jgi:catechol 2,3-dioxygenase-like lactoylglutathione lyase family enzyme
MLTKPMAVMVNRGAQSLEISRLTVTGMKLPVVGEDPEDMVLCDSGTAMVGYGFRQQHTNFIDCQGCSKRFLDDVNPVINPATNLEFASTDVPGFVPQAAQLRNVPVAELQKNISKTAVHTQLSFFDHNGNLTTFTQHTEAAFKGKVGGKLRSLLTLRGFGVDAASPVAPPAPALIRITLMVSNLAVSSSFYSKVLGLVELDNSAGEVSFDAGPIILTIKPESKPGLVHSLKKQEALRDQVIFHTPNILAEVDNLLKQGVRFTDGIETSLSAGQVAYFADPDGHNLWLWQPPPGVHAGMRIDYYPILNRILREHA